MDTLRIHGERPGVRAGIAALAAALVLTGCAQAGPKTAIGSAGGAAAGGLIASAAGGGTKGIIGGVLLGALLSGAVGNALDQRDREYAAQTTYHALETGRSGSTSTWRNPDSGHHGSVTPTRTYENARGRYCREYEQTIYVGGHAEQGYGTACRQPDGSWQIVRQ